MTSSVQRLKCKRIKKNSAEWKTYAGSNVNLAFSVCIRKCRYVPVCTFSVSTRALFTRRVLRTNNQNIIHCTHLPILYPDSRHSKLTVSAGYKATPANLLTVLVSYRRYIHMHCRCPGARYRRRGPFNPCVRIFLAQFALKHALRSICLPDSE